MSSMVYLIIAVLSSASMAIVLKIFQKQKGNRYGIILGNYLTCVLLSFLLMPEKHALLSPDPITLLCGIAAGVLFVAGLVSMQSSIAVNGAILTSAFSKLGLIVPLLISAVFFGDRIRILQIPGIVLIFLSFWLILFDKDSIKKQQSGIGSGRKPVLLLAVLLACGFADAMVKVFEHVGKREEDQLYFLILFAAAALITCFLMYMEYRKTGKKLSGKEFLAGILVGIPNYFSSALLLQALTGLPSFVVYPCFCAGTLLLVTVVGAAFFRERPGKRAWAGLAVIVLALVLLNL